MSTSPTPSRKRASSPDETEPRSSKRQRLDSADSGIHMPELPAQTVEELFNPSTIPSLDEQMRHGLQRSIALALDHVGFDSSRKDALESFTLLTETYLQSLVQEVQFTAAASRRAQPTPLDFEKALGRFNLRPADLKPHRRNPVKKSKREPKYFDPAADSEPFGNPLPIIGSAAEDKRSKEAKSWIPQTFPDFPPIHTYKYTPIDAATCTIKGPGMRYDDGTPVGAAEQTPEQGLHEIRGNPQKTREAAAKQAKQAEEALLGLVRASKKNNLNEARAAAERNPLSKQRYDIWESTMRELLEEPGLGGEGGMGNAERARVNIAEQCMMVNAEKQYHRKEIQRLAKPRSQKAA